MNKKYSKVISMLLAFVMLLSVFSTTTVFSASEYYSKLEATNASVTLDGTNPGSVTVSLIGNSDMDVYAIQGDWETQDSAGKLTLNAITTDVSNVKFTGMNYADAPTGKVLWTDDTFSAPAVLSDGTRFLNATYTVAADTPSGTYTVSFRTEVLTATDYNSYQDETYYTATITVTRPEIHVCSGTFTKGQDATCTADGWQDYYSCSCGKFYADSACTTLIADLDAWKAEGGNGYIKANGHSFNNKASDTVATVATCQAPATYYVQCDNCTVTTTEKTVTKDDVKDSTNHTSQVIVYKNKTASTHDEYYACCDALKAAAVAHNYDSVTHACVCGAEKHTHAKYDNDANGHWSVCSCGEVLSEPEGHVPGAPADEYNNQICTVCEKILVNALGHQHNLHLVHKTALNPTCTEAGHKEYWQCDGCAETPCFEDANGTVVIADLDAWKAEGGNGYIKANGHSFNNKASDTVATVATCQAPATYYVQCDNCTVTTTEKTVTKDDVKDSTNHTSQVIVYKNKTASTHDEYYACCDALKAAAVAHNYDSVTHACVCGAEKHTHAKYDNDANGHWSVCSCGEVLSEPEGHVPGAPADEYNNQICTVCEKILVNALGHQHNLHLVHKTALNPTCTEAGHKEYWQCDGCAETPCFEDANGTVVIADLDAWKAEGGNGYIKANGHSFNNKASDTVATVATCQAPATYYVQCDNCTVTTTEKTVTKDDVKDSTNHTSQVIVYKNNTASTHDEYYACCDALKAAAVAHNYDSVTHACVCGAEKHTHAKYDNDANGHWSVCSCGEVLNETERHVPGAPADEYNNQICTVCERILVNALGHQHNLHLVHKTALNPTCTEAGHKEYWQCDGCAETPCFEDANGTVVIADLDAWKAEGGNGYIKANGHSFNNKASDTVATVATCQAPATYYVQCDNCTVTTTEKTVTKDDVKDSTNHTSQVIVYKNKTASTHDEYYACCDALKAAAVAHNYDSVTHACVCGAEKHTHAKYDNDANGHWSVCSCGEVLNETERHVPGAPADEYNNQICTVCERILVNALGHQHNLHLVHKTALNPTCTEAGHKEYWQCDGCAETPCFEDANGTVVIADLDAWKAKGGNGYIKANGHSFTTLSSGILATPANCQNPATYYVLCDNCNEHSTDKTIALDDVLNMNNHVSDKVVYKNVTETTHDEHYKCCDTLKTAAVAHQYDSTTHACVCGAEKHVHAKYEYNKDCHWSVCSCGEVLSAEADHDNDGELCEICGCVYHTCGGKEMTLIPEVPATCDDDGVKAYYECSCHKLYADKDAKTEITDLDAWKAGDGKLPAGCKYVTEYGYAATCTKDGLTDYVYCSVCKTVYSAATVIPGGHDWSAWVIVKIVDGVKYLERSCACGEHQEIISTPEHKHDLIKVDAVEATCETEGNIEYFYCQYCDWVEVAGGVASNLLAVKTPAAHKLVAVEAVAPTCTEFGNIAYWYCSACDWVEVEGGMASNLQAVKLAPAHTLVAVEAVAPTCTEFGNIAYWYCSACDWVEVEGGMASNLLAVKLAPIDHIWGEWVVTEPATETESGIETKTCTACGATEDRTIAALDHTHNLVKVEAKAATCTENGNIEYWYCTDCDWIEVEGGVASNRLAVQTPAAHTLVAVEAKAPTCTEFGNIAYWYCSACDWVEVEGGMASNLQAVKLAPAHTLVAVEAKAPTCTEFGNIAYWYCSACDWVEVEGGMASNLQAVKLAPAHTLVAVEAKAPTCTEFGNIAYWYCSACDWVEVEGGMASNLQAVKLAPAHNLVKVEAKAATCFEMGNIEYWYCTNCDWVEVAGGMASNRLAVLLPVSHNIVHVEAKAPTATENGNIEYWYCTNCGYAWLDELCTKNTNLKAVILPATGETPVDPENPGTGDNAIAFVLLGVLMLGATGVVIGKKKRFSVK